MQDSLNVERPLKTWITLGQAIGTQNVQAPTARDAFVINSEHKRCPKISPSLLNLSAERIIKD